MTKVWFVGSWKVSRFASASNSIGIGNIIIGTKFRKSNEGYELYEPNDEVWLPVFDVMKVSGDVESPMVNDMCEY